MKRDFQVQAEYVNLTWTMRPLTFSKNAYHLVLLLPYTFPSEIAPLMQKW
jgi:hypothetical protein